MKDEYLIWKRMEDELIRIIEESEKQLFINNNILEMVGHRLLRCEKPKNGTKEKTGA